MAGTLTKDQILDGISELSVLELSELLKEFEERFGVTAAAPVAVAVAAPAAGGGGEAAAGGDEEKSEFDVILTEAGDKKIQVIKEVRADQPGPQGGQGPRGRRPQAGAREGQQGGRREGQGPTRGRGGHRRAQVAPPRGPGRRTDGGRARLQAVGTVARGVPGTTVRWAESLTEAPTSPVPCGGLALGFPRGGCDAVRFRLCLLVAVPAPVAFLSCSRSSVRVPLPTPPAPAPAVVVDPAVPAVLCPLGL